MDRKRLLTALSDRLDLRSEPLPGVPVTELWGDNRILVENHRGVVSYTQEEIRVRVSYGILAIRGEKLGLLLMTRDQLIISGKMEGLTVERRATC